MIVAPAITSVLGGPLATAAVGLCAVVTQLALGLANADSDVVGYSTRAAAIALVSAALVLYSRSRRRREEQLAQARTVAEAAGEVLLKPPPARLGRLSLATAYRSAQQEAQVGGDFYAATRIVGGTRLIIGDVRGKGLDALEDTALVLGAFRAFAHHHLPLPELARELDTVLSLHNLDTDMIEDFATAVLVDLFDDADELALVCCGHPPPYVLGRGAVRALEAARPYPPLGLGELSPESRAVERHAYASGETLILYTDGVIEARNATGDFYPLAGRLAELTTGTAEQTTDAVVADLLDHTGGRLQDDVALLTVQRAPSAAAVAARRGFLPF
ncbi:PP2C family protein-serine/threonine phosphatase [Streptomyces sp. NPDC006925]|uniref:PP2C family protein-serine/threonine phosphatase n=1 Tax=Streptomyces sp. NPDC006925 TaxID=3364768 RepID=UPI00367733A1